MKPSTTSTTKRNMLTQLNALGYVKSTPLIETLQGGVWKSKQKSSNLDVVIKVTEKALHAQSIAIVDGKQYDVLEDIEKETAVLKYLSMNKKAPDSIVKFVDFLESSDQYFLVMEDGGGSLFDFVKQAHHFIAQGAIDISNWHKLVKLIFKQMIECIEYLHNRRICHMDVSLENFLINDVKVHVKANRVQFLYDDINEPVQVKICDFGLSELFKVNSGFKCAKHVGKKQYYSPEVGSRKRGFNAKSNDIFCLGVCLFLMITGGAPFKRAHKKDYCFRMIMNGKLKDLLTGWRKIHLVNNELLELFEMIFKYEDERADIEQIKNCRWLKD